MHNLRPTMLYQPFNDYWKLGSYKQKLIRSVYAFDCSNEKEMLGFYHVLLSKVTNILLDRSLY